jgi:hypothetical protein
VAFYNTPERFVYSFNAVNFGSNTTRYFKGPAGKIGKIVEIQAAQQRPSRARPHRAKSSSATAQLQPGMPTSCSALPAQVPRLAWLLAQRT